MQVCKKDEKSLTERWAEKTLTRHPHTYIMNNKMVK